MFKFVVTVVALAIFWTNSDGRRIIGGETANAGQFPFIASIYKSTDSGTFFCAGTLFGNQWILTAGQCVLNATLFSIRLGSNNLNSNDENVVRLTTETYFLHPEFNPETLENDVGIIKLRQPITLTDFVKPISVLSSANLEDGTTVSTVGWGQTSDQQAGLSDDLNFVSLVTLSNEECRLTFGNQVTDNMVCVDGNFNEGTCRGDLGGPLLEQGIILSYIVGISSFISSRGCESTDPSGFTRTAPYVGWIINVTTTN